MLFWRVIQLSAVTCSGPTEERSSDACCVMNIIRNIPLKISHPLRKIGEMASRIDS